MLEFKAGAGVNGVECTLGLNFDLELPTTDYGWETYKTGGVTINAAEN